MGVLATFGAVTRVHGCGLAAIGLCLALSGCGAKGALDVPAIDAGLPGFEIVFVPDLGTAIPRASVTATRGNVVYELSLLWDPVTSALDIVAPEPWRVVTARRGTLGVDGFDQAASGSGFLDFDPEAGSCLDAIDVRLRFLDGEDVRIVGSDIGVCP